MLDFIGLQRAEFRFDQRLAALTGIPRGRLVAAVEEDFPYLPSGCNLELDRIAASVVLNNLRAQVRPKVNVLVAEVRSAAIDDLETWLADSGRTLADVYAKGHSWTELRQRAGRTTSGGDEPLLKRLHKLLAVDDLERASVWSDWLSSDTPPSMSALTLRQQRLAAMLVFTMWNDGGGHATYDEALVAIWRSTVARREALDLLRIVRGRMERVPIALPSHFDDCPLWVHATYSRRS